MQLDHTFLFFIVTKIHGTAIMVPQFFLFHCISWFFIIDSPFFIERFCRDICGPSYSQLMKKLTIREGDGLHCHSSYCMSLEIVIFLESAIAYLNTLNYLNREKPCL